MDTLFIVLRIALSLVLFVSAVAKFFDRDGSSDAMRGFGVPQQLVPVGVIALPVFEVALAVGLILGPTLEVASAGASILFLSFSVGVGLNLVKGNRIDCHCFGQIHSSETSWATVGRNAILTALAVSVLIRSLDVGSNAIWADWTLMQIVVGTSIIAALGVLGGLLWLCFHLWEQQGRLLIRLEALELTAGRHPQAPTLERTGTAATAIGGSLLTNMAGERQSAGEVLLTGSKKVVLFTDPNCSPCETLMPLVATWQQHDDMYPDIVVIGSGSVEKNRHKAGDHGLINVFVDQKKVVSASLGARGTPCAVVIDEDGFILGEPVCGVASITQVVNMAAPPPVFGNGSERSTVIEMIGEPLPLDAVKTPDGVHAQLSGRPAMIVFWNPNCGFCSRMSPRLEELVKNLDGRADLTFVSSGSPDSIQHQQLPGNVWLDETFSLGRAVGSGGTPSAVFVDSEGVITSPVFVGEPQIISASQELEMYVRSASIAD